MKDGRLAASGSLDELIKKEPDTYMSWLQAIVEEKGPQSESQQVENSKDERTALKRQYSKRSLTGHTGTLSIVHWYNCFRKDYRFTGITMCDSE